MKQSNRVIWLFSRKRPVLVGHGVQRVPAVIVRVCKRRIRPRMLLSETEKLVNVNPDNVICEDENRRDDRLSVLPGIRISCAGPRATSQIAV